MAKRLVVSIFDSATRLYSQPAFMAARGQALRSFGDEVRRKSPDNPLSLHPEDYELRAVAVWDDELGTFESFEAGPETLARGKDFSEKV